jgi:hypothetical protein
MTNVCRPVTGVAADCTAVAESADGWGASREPHPAGSTMSSNPISVRLSFMALDDSAD